MIWVRIWTQLSSKISGSATIKFDEFDCPQLYLLVKW